jgi:hypothetical protein
MEVLANWAVGGLSASGLVALIYVTLTFVRSSRTDAVSAYSDLYQTVLTKCEKCETDLEIMRKEKDEEIEALKARVIELEMQMNA